MTNKKDIPIRKDQFGNGVECVIDYKKTRLLSHYLTERGKLISRRVTGKSRYQQELIVQAIKRARHLGLLPYTITHALRD